MSSARKTVWRGHDVAVEHADLMRAMSQSYVAAQQQRAAMGGRSGSPARAGYGGGTAAARDLDGFAPVMFRYNAAGGAHAPLVTTTGGAAATVHRSLVEHEFVEGARQLGTSRWALLADATAASEAAVGRSVIPSPSPTRRGAQLRSPRMQTSSMAGRGRPRSPVVVTQPQPTQPARRLG
jgi:hypothetical protein